MTDATTGTILVTGAARRIGRAIAADLAAAGWAVAVHYNTSATAGRDVAAAINRNGGAARAFQADLADEAAVTALIAKIGAALGPVSGLINNASVFEEDNITSADRQSWERHMAVNLRAPFLLIQSLAAQLPAATAGNVINLLDQRVLNLTPYFASYTLSKAALWTLTQTAALSLAPAIRVNAIGPGPTLPSARQSDHQFTRQWSATPLRRAVDPLEICRAVRFILASPSMTGQLIALDAGQHLGWSQPPADASLEE